MRAIAIFTNQIAEAKEKLRKANNNDNVQYRKLMKDQRNTKLIANQDRTHEIYLKAHHAYHQLVGIIKLVKCQTRLAIYGVHEQLTNDIKVYKEFNERMAK